MPSLKTITPILGGSYYHLFNRGVNRQPIFFQQRNYEYFLELLKKYLSEYVDIMAYCLLPNHFHLVIHVKQELMSEKLKLSPFQNEALTEIIKGEEEIGKIVSNQLKRMFTSYSMAINIQENRSGALFNPKFKRVEITENEFLEYAIFYVHYNPEKHGITRSFKDYKYNSYQAIISDRFTHINREMVLEIFGDKNQFIQYHKGAYFEREDFVLE